MPRNLEDMLLTEPETEEVEEQEDDDEVDESDVEETEDADEELREAGKKALEAERKARREDRKTIKALKAELEALKTGKDKESEQAKIRAEVAREFGKELAKEKAVAALTEAGYRGNAARGAKLIDLDDLVDNDGRVDAEALRDVVSEWRDEEPDLFGDSPVRRRSSGSADLGKKKASRTEKDPLAEALGSLVGRPELA